MKQCAVNAAAAVRCRLSLSRIDLFSVRRAGSSGSLGLKRAVNGRQRVKDGFRRLCSVFGQRKCFKCMGHMVR